MKIRMGFVSNSSSSSFVCLGVRIKIRDADENLSDDQLYEIIDDYRDLVYYDGENSDDYFYYGSHTLHSSEDYGIQVTNVLKDLSKGESLEQLEKRLKEEARELFLLSDEAELEFGLFTGVVAS